MMYVRTDEKKSEAGIILKYPMIKNLFTIIVLCVLGISQTHFTVPKNVWRISTRQLTFSGKWKSQGGTVGTTDEYFTISGYGSRYYDPNDPNSSTDLVGLGEQYVDAFNRVDEIIMDFNQSESASAWGDTLFDFTRDFFGPDSVQIYGTIIDTLKRTENAFRMKVEYGMSDRYTIYFEIPYFFSRRQDHNWEWRDNSENDEMLSGFSNYHFTNKTNFEQLMASEYFASFGADTVLLKKVYNRFYSISGKNSLLWAMNGGDDPIKNGIYGSPYNPFSNSDTAFTTLDSILLYYHPDQNASGLGDIQWGVNILLYGSPAWAGESLFSVYGGIGLTIPTARVIQSFNKNILDKQGRPKQLNFLPLGEGVTSWHFAFFGEFYREVMERLIRFNWRVDYRFNIEGKFNTSVSPRGLFFTDSDSIMNLLGDEYRKKVGDSYSAELKGYVEMIPDLLSVTAGQRWLFKERDRYFSDFDTWNEWMGGGTNLHKGYDTRIYQVSQSASIIFHNSHPFKKKGPIPFDVEFQALLPLLTRHTWNGITLSINVTSYFQFW